MVDLVAHLDERFEDVERKLLVVDDVPEMMHRRPTLLHIRDREVVLPKKLVCFVLRHSSPLEMTRGMLP
jgi:hypothetical protein